MNKIKVFLPLLMFVVIAGLAVWYIASQNVPVMQPAGPIGESQRNLIYFGLILSAIVVVPTFGLAIFIAWKYREGNIKPKKYRPDFDHSRLFESIWWGIPIAIITVLSVVTWITSHQLDPYKKLASSEKPLTVQVVALDWKWLFIYPQQQVASVNELAVPTGRPIEFELTSDTVMNSFWIPQLGSQIYVMPGMVTELNLMAERSGEFYGSPANIAGEGFASMTFDVKAMSGNKFNSWVNQTKGSSNVLNSKSYSQLAKPSKFNPTAYYSSVQGSLFKRNVMNYMSPEDMQMRHNENADTSNGSGNRVTMEMGL